METVLRLNPKPPLGVYGYYGAVLFINRQYEKAIEPLEKARAASNIAKEHLAMTYAQLGRLDDAKVVIDSMWPDTSLSFYRVLYMHYKREEDRVQLLDALRKAGLPEWPFGYEGLVKDRLDGNSIRRLTLGRTWVGQNPAGIKFIQEIGEDGKFAYRSNQSFITGQASVKGDMLCLKSEYLMGRERCGYVYRTPGGMRAEKNEFVYVGATALMFFSPER